MESSQSQLKVKAVVVTMFDEGDDVIAESGEFKLWCDRENLNKSRPHSPIATLNREFGKPLP